MKKPEINKEMKNITKMLRLISIILLLLVVYYIFQVYIQQAVLCSGSENNGKGYFNINLNLELKEALKIGAVGGSTAVVVKACPPQTRPAVVLGLGVLAGGTYILNNYVNNFGSNNEGNSIRSEIKTNKLIPSDDSGKGISKLVLDELSKICINIKEKFLGAPINCAGDPSSWNPMDNINELLIGFSEEQKFFIGVILLL